MDGSWKFPEKVQGDSRNFHEHRLTGFEVCSYACAGSALLSVVTERIDGGGGTCKYQTKVQLVPVRWYDGNAHRRTTGISYRISTMQWPLLYRGTGQIIDLKRYTVHTNGALVCCVFSSVVVRHHFYLSPSKRRFAALPMPVGPNDGHAKIETSEARAEARPEARAQNEQWKDAAAVKTSTAACLVAGGKALLKSYGCISGSPSSWCEE